jgi:predicted PurR-regulated permease PerM
MKNDYWRNVTSTVILALLVVLSFLLLKPILLSMITGLILAFIFRPVYKWTYKRIKRKNLSAGILTTLLVALVVIPLWFLIPVLINQSIQIFISSQNLDLIKPLESLFPSIFSSEIFSNQMAITIQGFVTRLASSIMTGLSNLISNFPIIFLKTIVVLFTFFFTLRDNENFTKYVQSILPFSKDVEKKLFNSSRDITSSILYGQVLIGIIQGVFVGIGFFAFGVNNALFLTIAAAIAGIFPIIGTAIIWVPVVIFLFVGGQTIPALGLISFGLVSSLMENTVKPVFIAKRTNVHSSVILFGMIGGLLFFGIIGFILGPLILSYLIIVLEIYRDKKVPGLLINEDKN